jgi:hypothetical protein
MPIVVRSPFDKLRANGLGVASIDDCPFVPSLSKHAILLL